MNGSDKLIRVVIPMTCAFFSNKERYNAIDL